ncbi:uncharacterized protein DNG_05368 [Cephalotrichum gorgonifer]|uniref:Uncharacterized protein n=1 Tax=Cephalotrichum gorgonifer TaxID=2041049 RepID=A0AAE8N0K8_9PEZI|nr:uncharacterized protein DNG_05368 [Cephalotrichum gorgonifer]
MSTRAIYRSLLRELPPRPILQSPRSPLHNRLRTTFSNPGAEDTALGEQFVAYLSAQRTYGVLLERYNPGMNMDEEERVRLSARRVGLDLPEAGILCLEEDAATAVACLRMGSLEDALPRQPGLERPRGALL